MSAHRRETIEADQKLQRMLKNGLPLYHFTSNSTSIRHLSWMGASTPNVPIVRSMNDYQRNPGESTIVTTVSPVDFVAFQAYAQQSGQQLPDIHTMSSMQFHRQAQSNDLPFKQQDKAAIFITFAAKCEQDPGCLVSLSPALYERFIEADLHQYRKELNTTLDAIPYAAIRLTIYDDRPSLYDDRPSLSKHPKVSPVAFARAPGKAVMPYIDENRIVFTSDMRVAAVPPHIGAVLKGGLWYEKNWENLFESSNIKDLIKKGPRLFNEIAKGEKLGWIFNCTNNRRENAFAIIPTSIARSNLTLAEDGFIEGVRSTESATSAHKMMAQVKTNFDTTYITLSPDTYRKPKENGQRRALHVDLPPEQKTAVSNALAANTFPLAVQGRAYHLEEQRPLERRHRSITDSMGGPASLVFDEAVSFQVRHSHHDNSSTSTMQFGHQATLTQLVTHQSNQVIIRANGEEFLFSAEHS